VAYANTWKERFLHVRHDTLHAQGAVSPETVEEMLAGLLQETAADYAIAVSGAFPSYDTIGGKIGSVYIGVVRRGEKVDLGNIQIVLQRKEAIAFAVHTALGALWRRVVHNTPTFS